MLDTAGVSALMPKSPTQLPSTLINNAPNQSPNLKLELVIFTRFTPAAALPLVAAPAFLLPLTVASPLAAVTEMLLVMCVVSVALYRMPT